MRIEWAQFGDFDYFDILRSNSPMNESSLPLPLATNVTKMYYIDYAVAQKATYYYRIVAWKNGIKKISNEFKLYTKDLSNYSAFFYLTENNFDKKGGSDLLLNGNALITSVGVYFDGVGDYCYRSDTAATTFGTGDLTIECIFKCDRIGTHTYEQALVDNFITGNGGWQIGLRTDGRVYVYMNTPNSYVMNSTASFSDGNEHHVAWTRNGSTNRLFVDGVQVATATDSRNFTAKTYFAIGAQVNGRNANYDFKGWIRNVGVSKQALYTSNFTPDMG